MTRGQGAGKGQIDGRPGMGQVPYSRRVALAVAALCGAAAQCPAECQHAVPCGLPMCGPHCCAFYGKRRQPTKEPAVPRGQLPAVALRSKPSRRVRYAYSALRRARARPCQLVQSPFLYGFDEELCAEYVSQPLATPPSCPANLTQGVPRLYHAVGKGAARPPNVDMNAAVHLRGFEVRYHDDKSAAAYVSEHCGEEAGQAYRCFVAPAYRADLFRFCAMYAEGGVYVDTDIVLLEPISSIVNTCDGASIGYDIPAAARQSERKQMKLLASVPSHPLARCMVESIVDNVRHRFVSRKRPLLLTGPELLQECYNRTRAASDTMVTYRDSVRAVYPYTGLVGARGLIAFEQPNTMDYPQTTSTPISGDMRWTSKTFRQPVSSQVAAMRYGSLTSKGRIYTRGCAVPKR